MGARPAVQPAISLNQLVDWVEGRMAAPGPKRHFAAPNNRVAIGVTTDIVPVLNASVVNDP